MAKEEKKQEPTTDEILKRMQAQMADLTAKNAQLSAALFERETAGKDVAIVGEDEAPAFSKGDLALIDEACKAHGIGEEDTVKMRIEKDGETGEPAAVVITAGGSRVRYRKGDRGAKGFLKLSQIQVTGVNPEAAKRKPIIGKGVKE